MKIGSHITFLSLIASLVILSSCKKEKSFSLKVVNETNYDIKSLSFSGIPSGESISVSNNGASETVILSYPRRFRIMPKIMNIYIDSFDNQGNNFAFVHLGSTLPFSYREIDDETVNTVFLRSTENQDTLRFSFSFE